MAKEPYEVRYMKRKEAFIKANPQPKNTVSKSRGYRVHRSYHLRGGLSHGFRWDEHVSRDSLLYEKAWRRDRFNIGKSLIFLFAILLMFSFLYSSFMVETKTQMGEGTYLQRYGFASKYDGGYYWEFDGSRLMEKLGDLKTENLFESFISFELGYINKDDYKGDSKVGETVFAVVSAILNAVILIFNVVLSILDIIVFFIQELVTVIEILIIIIKDGFVYMEPYKIPVGG